MRIVLFVALTFGVVGCVPKGSHTAITTPATSKVKTELAKPEQAKPQPLARQPAHNPNVISPANTPPGMEYVHAYTKKDGTHVAAHYRKK